MTGTRKFQTRIFLTVMSIVCSVTTLGVGMVSAQVVDIPDPNLRAEIEEALGKDAGATITVPEMENLTYLFAFDTQIRDLTGLETATNLNMLWVSDSVISDITALAALTNLTDLNLNSNAITDISPLTGLTGLTDLWLGSNPISDISPLAGLTNLTHLYLGDTALTDISALAKFDEPDRSVSWIQRHHGYIAFSILNQFDESASRLQCCHRYITPNGFDKFARAGA